MPRAARAVSVTGYYHVFARGVSHQIIFECDQDRYKFLGCMQERFEQKGITVVAWCLMDNHFHVLLDDPNQQLSSAMQGLLTAYAKYFNERTNRTGHLFENRFSSIPVETDAYALTVADYIHLNPVKGKAAFLGSYRWSSYRAYLDGYDSLGICDPTAILELVGGSSAYSAWISKSAKSFKPLVAERREFLSDDEALAVAREVLNPIDPTTIRALRRAERDECLCILRAAGLMVKQIGMVTGVGLTTISTVTRDFRAA